MARKTMAERYATQRSRKVTRRRALPRLSDSETALEERDLDDAYMDDDAPDDGAARATVATFTSGSMASTGAARARGATATMPRHAPRTSRPGALAAAAAASTRVDYGYVRRDLRRIAVTAVAMLALLVVLNLVVQAFFIR